MPVEILADPPQSFGGDIDRHQFAEIGAGFEYMGRLSAGCGTQVQDALARSQIHQIRRELRGGILYGNLARAKARYGFDGQGLFQGQSTRA